MNSRVIFFDHLLCIRHLLCVGFDPEDTILGEALHGGTFVIQVVFKAGLALSRKEGFALVRVPYSLSGSSARICTVDDVNTLHR